MAKTVEVKIPELGGYKDVPVIDILVAEGETVDKEAALITLESEKATMEVPAPEAGTVRGIRVKVGEKVNPGAVILMLELAESAEPPPQAASAKAPPAEPAPPQAASAKAPPAEPAPPQPAQAAAAAPPAPSQDRKTTEVIVPDLGDYRDVPIIEVLVADGASVDKDEPLLVLESEKATMELPAPAAGIIRGLKVKAGDKVSKGDRVCELETADDAAAPAEAAPAPSSASAPTTNAAPPKAGQGPQPALDDAATPAEPDRPIPPWTAQAGEPVPHASPAIRKFARELGVPLDQVAGTGPKGRILREDVQGFVKTRIDGQAGAPRSAGGIPSIPAVDFAQWGEIEQRPLSRIRRLSAQYLHRSWLNVPHVTQFDAADITELEAFRKAQAAETGQKLTLLPLLMKAVGAALQSFPEFNAALAPGGEQLILKKYCHIGFAADTEQGLVVPVVRDVWNKGILQLAEECAALAAKARDGKLKADDMKGGCFSISSLGGLGVSGGFTPIVNAPEVAILGVSRAQMQPVWDGQQFQPRLMLPLSLSYDHRVIDGAYAARFTVHLSRLLSDMRRTLL